MVVGSGLAALGFPAANIWTAGRWCFTRVGVLAWDHVVGRVMDLAGVALSIFW